MLFGGILSSCLVLNKKHDILIVLYKTKPWEHLMHYALVKVVYNTELFELSTILNHVLLNLLHLIFRIVKDTDGYLVCIIVQVYKSVVEEKATIALLSIAIINLLSSFDIVKSLDYEATTIVCIVPSCLSRALMIEHVCIGNESISLYSFNLNTKDTTWDHHANLWVLTEWKLGKLRHFFTY